MNNRPTARPRRTGESGFTLLELLVTLAVVATTLALAAAGVRILGQDWDRKAHRVDQLDMVARTADLLQRDAAGLQRIVATVSSNAWFLFVGQPTSLSFAVREPSYPTNEGTYFVNYLVTTNGGEKSLVRARAPLQQNMVNFPGATPANQVVLMGGTHAFAFAYGVRGAGAGAGTKWYHAWPYDDRLPDLIRLQVADAGTGAPTAPPIVVRLRADAELDCLGRSARHCTVRSAGILRNPGRSAPVLSDAAGPQRSAQ